MKKLYFILILFFPLILNAQLDTITLITIGTPGAGQGDTLFRAMHKSNLNDTNLYNNDVLLLDSVNNSGHNNVKLYF